MTKTAWASSSAPSDLPSLGVLQTWVHRPQALAKCTISDLYGMRALVRSTEESGSGYTARDVFMLNRFPCRMVEIVGWVSGVDEKEKSQVVYLDDGDGKHILPVTVRLPLVKIDPSPRGTGIDSSTKTRDQSQTQTQTKSELQNNNTTRHFVPAKERKAIRKAAFLEHTNSQSQNLAPVKGTVMKKEKEYRRNDIRVGDTVRIKGRVEEWRRGNEWVRQVVVEPGSAGIIVDAEQQYLHLALVLGLHETLYSRPFDISSNDPVPISQGVESVQDTTFGTLNSIMVSSEIASEMSVDYNQVKLCQPSKLRSSQLTDRTFRLYLLDHMCQEITRSIEELSSLNRNQGTLAQALETTFPEYRNLLSSSLVKGESEDQGQERTPFKSRLVNTFDSLDQSTPRPKAIAYKSKSQSQLKPQFGSQESGNRIDGYTISSLLSIPHLAELAGLVVDEQSRKEEKRRRRRIRDGLDTPKDISQVGGELQSQSKIQTQDQSQTTTQSQGGWRLTASEKGARMERLVKWVIRGLSEEGVLVQVKVSPGSRSHDTASDLGQWPHPTFGPDDRTPRKAQRDRHGSYRKQTHVEEGYIPLPEPLLLPLLIPHITSEIQHRSKVYIKKTDPRYGHGILLEEVLGRMRRFGEDGRWERLGEFSVEDALVWGEGRGLLKKVGKGWVVGEAG